MGYTIHKGIKLNGKYYGIVKKIKTTCRDEDSSTVYVLEKPYSSEIIEVNIGEFEGNVEFINYDDVKTKSLKLNNITNDSVVVDIFNITATLDEYDNGCIIGRKTVDIEVPFEKVAGTIFIKLNGSSFVNNARRVDLLIREIYRCIKAKRYENVLGGVKQLTFLCSPSFKVNALNNLFDNTSGYVSNTEIVLIQSKGNKLETKLTYNLLMGNDKFKVNDVDYDKWSKSPNPVEFKISSREGVSLKGSYDRNKRNVTVSSYDGKSFGALSREDSSDLVRCILSDLHEFNWDGEMIITAKLEPREYSGKIFKDLELKSMYELEKYIEIDNDNEAFIYVRCVRGIRRIRKEIEDCD